VGGGGGGGVGGFWCWLGFCVGGVGGERRVKWWWESCTKGRKDGGKMSSGALGFDRKTIRRKTKEEKGRQKEVVCEEKKKKVDEKSSTPRGKGGVEFGKGCGRLPRVNSNI